MYNDISLYKWSKVTPQALPRTVTSTLVSRDNYGPQ